MEALIDRIFAIETEEEFNVCALEVFHFQYDNVSLYKEFVDTLGRKSPTHYSEIPFLPIQFFKKFTLCSSNIHLRTIIYSNI